MAHSIKGLKVMDTHKIMVYSELLTAMIEKMDSVGMQATQACEDKIINETTMRKIHNDLTKQINIVEPKRIELVKELNNRIKKDVGLNRGTSDMDMWLHSFKTEYPDMFLSKAEFEFRKMQDKKKEAVKKTGKVVDLKK